jgi:predicted DNA-binding transcriptional regulator AlpA
MTGANERPGSAARGVVSGQFQSYQPTRPSPVATNIEPLLSVRDLTRLLSRSRRLLEQMRAAGRLPRPDFMLGRLPRWKAATIRAWIESGGGQ